MSMIDVVLPKPPDESKCIVRIIARDVALPSQAADLKREILAAIRPETCRVAIIDCSNVRHMSTDALVVLLAIQKRLTSRGGQVRLCHIDPSVEQSLRLCMLHKSIGFYRTLQDALA